MVALPLSVVRMVRSVLFFKVLNAALSAFVMLSLGLEEVFIILTVSTFRTWQKFEIKKSALWFYECNFIIWQ